MQELIELLRQLQQKCLLLMQGIDSRTFCQKFARQSQTSNTAVVENLVAISSSVSDFHFQNFIKKSKQFILRLEELHTKKGIALDVQRELVEKYRKLLASDKSRELTNKIDLEAEIQQLVSQSKERSSFLLDWRETLEQELRNDVVREASPNLFFELKKKIELESEKIKKLEKYITECRTKIEFLHGLKDYLDVEKDVKDLLKKSFSCEKNLAEIKQLLQGMGFDPELDCVLRNNDFILGLFNTYQEIAVFINKIIEKIDDFDCEAFVDSSCKQVSKSVNIVASLQELNNELAARCNAVGYRELERLDEFQQALAKLKQMHIWAMKESEVVKNLAVRVNEVRDYQQGILPPLRDLDRDARDYITGELFNYTYALFKFGGKGREFLEKLEQHSKNHQFKSQAIADFLVDLSNCKSLHEVKGCLDRGLSNPALMESTSPWGKKFEWESTTAQYIKGLKQAFDEFNQSGLKVELVRKDISRSIQRMKNLPLEPRQATYDCIKKIFELLKPHAQIKEVADLLASLVDLANFDVPDDHARIVGLVVAMHQARDLPAIARNFSKKIFTSTGRHESLYDLFSRCLSICPLTIKQVWRSNYPFAARYQLLKFNVSQCGTKRSCEELWSELDGLAKNGGLSEVQRYNQMAPIVESFYVNIRQSAFGSPSLFGRGSRLAEALAHFMKDGDGLNFVGDRVKRLSSQEPSLFLSCLGMVR